MHPSGIGKVKMHIIKKNYFVAFDFCTKINGPFNSIFHNVFEQSY